MNPGDFTALFGPHCSVCGQRGHNKRSCPDRASTPPEPTRAPDPGPIDPVNAERPDLPPAPTRNALRSRRKRVVRGKTIGVRRLGAARPLDPGAAPRRLPITRGECAEGPRPCPYVSCAHHLLLDVTDTGGIKVNFPDLLFDDDPDLDGMPATCVLDIAERGGVTLEVVGTAMNITRERARQIEAAALAELERQLKLRELTGAA